MLPFNARHLGAAEYGLWMLAASIVAYFPVLELGYGAAMERFVAHYRAQSERNGDQRDRQHAGLRLWRHRPRGAGGARDHRLHLGAMFDLSPAQARTGGLVLLLISLQFTLGLPFAIFGGSSTAFSARI